MIKLISKQQTNIKKKLYKDDGTVNRRALGGIVFSDKSKLTRLNEIVWPEIARMADEQAKQLFQDGHKVIVMSGSREVERIKICFRCLCVACGLL